MTWHILDTGSIWLKEFAAAMGKRVPTVNWQPVMRTLPWPRFRDSVETQSNPDLTIYRFPLQRGYARFPLSAFMPFAPGLLARMNRVSQSSGLGELRDQVLVCTTPYYAPVAERWHGRVVYYQTDLTIAYAGVNPRLIRSLDQRLCRVAELVCPNSDRIADYFEKEAWCPARKITVVPNATRAANIYPAPPSTVSALPDDVADLPRPVAGVIGNLAANMDWEFIEKSVRCTPALSWLFVGPASMPCFSAEQSAARTRVMTLGGRVRFLGARPYGELQAYARAVDVAVLPYRKSEPTYSGSSTRFYEHLAACRPILATRGFAELLQKEPLLQLVDDASQAAAAIDRLSATGFRDGLETERWRASQQGTWEQRAETMLNAFDKRESQQVDSDFPGQLEALISR